MVKDIQGGAGSGYPHGMTVVGDTLFFIATDGSAYHYGLWASDGTGPGTYRVSNVWPWHFSPGYGYIPGIDYESLAALGDTLFLTADDGVRGAELWASDGTMAGTRMVADIAPGLYPAMQGASPNHLTAVGDMLLFYADDGVHGREMWASDGTRAGTRLVADIGAGYDWPSFEHLTAVRGMLYFSAWNDGYGRELWVSDGATAGTRLVADIWPGDGSSYASAFTLVGDTLYFRANDGVHGSELWALPLPPLAARNYLPLIRR